MNKYLRYILATLLIFSCACTKSSHDDNGDGDDIIIGDGFMSACGVVNEGMLKNPILPEEGIAVTTEIVGPNLAIASFSQGKILVKIQGLDTVDREMNTISTNALKEIAGDGQAVYFPAELDCTVTTTGGGIAQVGSLFTLAGKSYAEELIKKGLAEVEAYDSCSGRLNGNCLVELSNNSTRIAGVISDFLWKPVAEKDGKLVVLLNPYGATIVVNGETLSDSGSGNGRGTIARGNKTGCAYGAARVRVYNANGDPLLFPNGSVEYTIPNGCNRYEF
ncbi:MAG: hypothetical protein ACOX2O_00020 [Bdellovibrionota bacterium]|jgi:hypothetical protein